jgi:UDP-N-acetyl-D-glucosamine dehydrogenase
LREKLEARTARVSVVGLGYVGLSLAVELAKAGIVVRGVDLDLERVSLLNRGETYLVDVPAETLAPLVASGRLSGSTSFEETSASDAVIICVPTPLRKSKEPDISYILSAVESLLPYLHPGQMMVLESTTYPGTTEEVVLPRLQQNGLVIGSDFFLAFSPERVDPGNPTFNTRNIPKVVGGVTAACTSAAVKLYRQRLEHVVAVSSTQVAEMVKLLENTFRSVNIGLVNELALMCARLKIDVWEVIRAAATKPFGFMPFYPGPGLGGHCIPIDPFYLSWKARASGFEARFIELAGHVNGHMPDHVVDLVLEALNRQGQSVRGSRVLILGVAYKADIDDVRESPSLDIMEKLREKGAKIEYSDPHVASIAFAGGTLKSVPLNEARVKAYDCVVVATAHKAFDYAQLLQWSKAIVDTRNALAGKRSPKIVRL